MNIVFIAGTGTEVGKTFVAKGIVAAMRSTGVRIGVYKPVASGCIPHPVESFDSEGTPQNVWTDSPATGPVQTRSTILVSSDAMALWHAAGCPQNHDAVCPQCFQSAVAPDEAARREQRTVDSELLIRGAEQWREHCDTLVVEGAGGLFSPIAEDLLNIDLYLQLSTVSTPDAALYLVAANRLGVIHDCIATAHAAAARGVRIDRLYLSDASMDVDASVTTNADQIRRWLPDLDLRSVKRGGTV